MNDIEVKSLLAQVENYLDLLEKPQQELQGLPTCPFIKKERIQNNLMVAVFNNQKENFLSKMEEFSNSHFTDAVFAQPMNDKLSTAESKTYQNFLNKLLKKHFSQYKAIVTNPSDVFEINSYNPRSLAPCFLIVVTDKNKLSKAHKQMMNSNYFNNFNDDYLKYLHVKKEDLDLK